MTRRQAQSKTLSRPRPASLTGRTSLTGLTGRASPTRAALKDRRSGFARWVFVALGANLGDSRRTLLEALGRLREFSSGAVRTSALWQSTPVDCPPGSPLFLNAVAGFAPRRGLTPESLLARLQQLEREFGRRPRQVRNEPRPLDLDLVAFGNQVRATDRLTLPHPRAHLRRFVLQPLAQIAPGLVLPGQSRTVAELLQALPPDLNMRVADYDCHGGGVILNCRHADNICKATFRDQKWD